MPTKTLKTTRPPVVTILGHVDHGKTSILDKIRETSVQAKEAGGITQNIGAYQIVHQGKTITFIDTPGHEAFSDMRKRGGKIADIAVLVVAADDGVMPQTKESLEHIKKANIPYLVAINKIDIPGVDVNKVKTGLSELGEYVEGFGGNVPFVEVSAKTSQGLDKLLELILLLAELEELPDTSSVSPAQAVVIESQLHQRKGPLATLLVKQGVFKLHEPLFLDTKKIGKIRSMTTFDGQETDSASPSTPIQVLGLSLVPSTGDIITNKPADLSQLKQKPTSKKGKLEEEKPNLIVKAAVQGGLEAVVSRIKDKANLVSSGIGAVTDTDIELASTNDATIVGFNSKISSSVKKLAKVEGVTFKNFSIIYHLFEYVDELAKLTKSPPPPEEVGRGKILKVFNINNQTIYGGVVTSGKIRLHDFIGQSKIVSLQSEREVVEEVKKDKEFGLNLQPHLDIKVGDVIITHNKPFEVK